MTSCPSLDELFQFLNGQLDPQAEQALQGHIQLCAACQRTLAGLDRGFPHLPEFEFQEELDRGGVGIIYLAKERKLSREVVIKVLRSRWIGNKVMRRRFWEEACITSQLQHPGIVPVHRLGRLPAPDRRPYMVMKRIKGEALSRKLAARLDGDRELLALLRTFAEVCRTVAYAHEHKVIHRDLKPDNIMVDRDGVALVVDWGLAKAIDREADSATAQAATPPVRALLGDTAPGTVVNTPWGGKRNWTRGALGTLPYMPPEQACGKVALQAEPSDVFSLGAILCEILTGLPPYHFAGPPDSEAIRRLRHQVELGELQCCHDRLDACREAPELIALAKKCLQKAPDERFANAGLVAAEMTTYLNGLEEQKRRAERDRAAADARAEEAERTRLEAERRAEAERRIKVERRARKKGMALLAAAVVLVVFMACGGTLWMWKDTSEKQSAAATTLDKVAELLLEEQWSEAEAVLQEAEKRVAASPTREGNQSLAKAQRDLRLARRLEDACLKAAVIRKGEFDEVSMEEDYARILEEEGIGTVEDGEREVVGRLRDCTVRRSVVAALDDWAGSTKDKARLRWLFRVAQLADPDPWRDQFRNPDVRQNGKALRELSQQVLNRQVPAADLSPRLLATLGRALRASREDPFPLLREALQRYPGDFWLSFYMGTIYYEAKKLGEAVECFRAATVIRPDVAVAHSNLGAVLMENHRPDEAVASCLRATQLDPELAQAFANLGAALADKMDLEGAFSACRRALELDPKLKSAHNNLGIALQEAGRHDEAIRAYQDALATDPKCPTTHANLCFALRAKGLLAQAVSAGKEATKRDPNSATAHANLGACFVDAKLWAQAIQESREAIRLDPDLAIAYNNLGASLPYAGDPEGAVAACQAALKRRPNYPAAETNLGSALQHLGRFDDAIAAFQRAIALNANLGQAHANLAVIFRQKGRFDDSLASLKTAHGLFSKAGSPLAKWSEEQLLLAARYIEIANRLPGLLTGKDQPRDEAERLALVEVCHFRRLESAAVRFYEAAFNASPQLGSNPDSHHRYNAACFAALAAADQGDDAKERTRLRRLALDWLRADLGEWAMRIDSGNAEVRATAAQVLRQWQADPDLSGVRKGSALKILSAEEREAWQRLWADVASLLIRSE